VLPESIYTNTVQTDHYTGPRKCDSGDTGSTMTVEDFAKFYEFLMRQGKTEEGDALLKPESVREITHGTFEGLDKSNKLAA